MTMQYPIAQQPLFSLGVACVAWHALQLLGWNTINHLLARHGSGDWGDVSPMRARANVLALAQQYPVLSQYEFPRFHIYVLTEDDRTRTFIVAHERP